MNQEACAKDRSQSRCVQLQAPACEAAGVRKATCSLSLSPQYPRIPVRALQSRFSSRISAYRDRTRGDSQVHRQRTPHEWGVRRLDSIRQALRREPKTLPVTTLPRCARIRRQEAFPEERKNLFLQWHRVREAQGKSMRPPPFRMTQPLPKAQQQELQQQEDTGVSNKRPTKRKPSVGRQSNCGHPQFQGEIQERVFPPRRISIQDQKTACRPRGVPTRSPERLRRY